MIDFLIPFNYTKIMLTEVTIKERGIRKCNISRLLRLVIFVRVQRRADAVSARHPASQHARQAAASLIRSARRAIRKTETIEDIA